MSGNRELCRNLFHSKFGSWMREPVERRILQVIMRTVQILKRCPASCFPWVRHQNFPECEYGNVLRYHQPLCSYPVCIIARWFETKYSITIDHKTFIVYKTTFLRKYRFLLHRMTSKLQITVFPFLDIWIKLLSVFNFLSNNDKSISFFILFNPFFVCLFLFQFRQFINLKDNFFKILNL